MAQNLIINQEYVRLVPEISTEEYEALKRSVKENGLYVPIIINQNGVLLDGHHRYKACEELGITVSHIVREFTDELDEKLFVIDCNLTRRQLNNFQRTELVLKSKPILEAIAKRNESLGGKGVRFLSPLGRVDEHIGDRAGVSRDTVRKVETIIEKAPEEVKHDLRAGKTSINQAFEDLNKPLIENRKQTVTTASSNDRSLSEPLTEQEKQYVEAFEREVIRDKKVAELLYEWTDKSLADLGGIMDKTPKGSDWRKKLGEESAGYMLKLAKQMTDSQVRWTLNDLRTLRYIADRFSDILYEEQELRKKKEELSSV